MEFVFTVSESEANVVVQALAAQPYGVVHTLMAKLHEQAARQRAAAVVAPEPKVTPCSE